MTTYWSCKTKDCFGGVETSLDTCPRCGDKRYNPKRHKVPNVFKDMWNGNAEQELQRQLAEDRR